MKVYAFKCRYFYKYSFLKTFLKRARKFVIPEFRT